ncbi:fibronectin type III domain-containing protein [Pacificoceanicola onchidii]|uniref:fibronectin type III domain-containing protein n=1 Tax=Pacificoceanicola onchidii TaxID=2562685 RepID=UPI0010A2C902|nr:fibronectin type III domain-containing protein [Pacificoceanicola onchidii]
MAPALGALLPGLFGAGGTVALVTAAGSLTWAGIALNVAGSLALSALTAPRLPDAAKPENIQINNKSATGPRIGHVGRVLVGGNIVFHRAKNGASYRVIVHGHGEITSVLEVQLDSRAVPLDPDGYVDRDHPPYVRRRNGGATINPKVRVLGRDGTVPSTHYGEITGIWPEWSADHRLDGLWTSMIWARSVSATKFQKVFPNGEPTLKVLAETAACFDPRSGLSGFTENAALVINHYASLPDGLNRPDAFDVNDIVAAADICDRDVALAEGGTEKMFRLAGSFLLNEKPQDVLGRMLTACAGRVRLKPTGKIGLKVGAWEPPEFTLGFGDILEVQEVNPGPDLLDRYNQVVGRFTSQDLGYIEVDAEPWRDDVRVAEDGEVLTGPDKTLIMCPSHRQARQCMKIHMERDNPKQEVSLLCKPKALPAIYEDTIALDMPQLALVGDYEVARYSLSFEKGLLRAVALVLRKVDSAAYSLALEEQGAVQELPEPDNEEGVPVPENVVAGGAGVQAAANTFVAGISAGWAAPPSDALSPVVRYSKAGEDNWKDVPVNDEATSVEISGLQDGQAYDVSVAFVTPGGVEGEEVIVENVVAVAVVDPPLPPTGLTVTDQSGGVALVELTASASASLWKTEVYRDGVLVGSIYSGPGAAISLSDSSSPGTFDWTARSVDVSIKDSATDAGPVTATIT